MFAWTQLEEACETVMDCVTCKVRHGHEIEVFVGSSTLNDMFLEDYYTVTTVTSYWSTVTTVTSYFYTASTVTSYC